ncbi:UNVERIFIED_CONTAM: hypothetical protein FKN15_047502 [Acipenser sinensis]
MVRMASSRLETFLCSYKLSASRRFESVNTSCALFLWLNPDFLKSKPLHVTLAVVEQFFSYLIVIDFESTCWREKNHYGQEIIEFPAVLLNTTNGQIDSEFQTYVQPQEHPTLSEFCTELTGIKQSQVEAGVPLQICLSQFSRWLQKLQQEKNVVFVTDLSGLCAPSAKPCAFVTWSDWDLGVCLQYECKRKQLRKPPVLNSWIDLRATYKLFYNRMPKGLNGALQDLGIEFCGREHSGLDDARNTAGLAWRMITDGCVMKVTKSLDRAPPKTTPPVRPLALNADVASMSKSSDSRKACSPNRMARSSKQEQAGDGDAVPNASKIKRLESDTLQTTLQAPRQQANTTGCQYRSLVSPKTLLHGLSAPGAWGRFSRPALTPQTHALGSLVSAGSPSTRSLVLVPTTVDSVTNISGLDLNTACDSDILLADWEDGAMLHETEEPSSYDAVTLEQEEGGWGMAMPAGTVGLTADVSYYADAEEFKNDVPPVCLKSQLLNTLVYSGEDAGAHPSGGGDAGAHPSGSGDAGAHPSGGGDAGAHPSGSGDAGAHPSGGGDAGAHPSGSGDAGAHPSGGGDAGAHPSGSGDAGAHPSGGGDAGAHPSGSGDAGAHPSGGGDAGAHPSGSGDAGAHPSGGGDAGAHPSGSGDAGAHPSGGGDAGAHPSGSGDAGAHPSGGGDAGAHPSGSGDAGAHPSGGGDAGAHPSGSGDAGAHPSGGGDAGAHPSGSGDAGAHPSGGGDAGAHPSGSGDAGAHPSGGGDAGAHPSGSGDAGAHPSGGGDAGAHPSGSGDAGAHPSGGGDAGAHPSGSGDAGAHPSGSGDAGAHPSGSGDAGAHPSGGGDAGAHPSGGGDAGARSSGSVAFKAPPAAAAAKSTSGANRARRTPTGSSSFSTARPRPLGGEKSTRSSLYFPKSNPSFTIRADEEALLSSRSAGSSVPPTVLSAVVNWRSFPPSSGGKVTPPLCECGRRAKKLNVSNGGPNQGKGFYCCPVGKQGCGYFKGESVLLKEKSRASFSASGSRTSFQIGNLGLRPSLRNECSNRVLKTGL